MFGGGHLFKLIKMERANEWDYWNDKKVFIILKNGRKYSGTIINVDFSAKPIIFISIIDKFNKRITFVQSEIEVIEEEWRR